MNIINSLIFIFLFSSCVSAMENSYTLDQCMFDLKSFVVSTKCETVNSKDNQDDDFALQSLLCRYKNLSFNANNQHDYVQKWLYDYSVMLSQDCLGSNIKIIFPNKREMLLRFYDREIHALSMNRTGKVIAALSSDSLHVANLDDEEEVPFYTYCFRKNKNFLSTCSCATLNEQGTVAAVGGVYNEGKNSYYRVCILQLNRESSVIEKNVLYVIHLPGYYPTSLQFIDYSLLINSYNKNQKPRVYSLDKGEKIVQILNCYQQQFIHALFLRVNCKRSIFYSNRNYHPQKIILTSEEKDAIELLPKEVVEFIFRDYHYL